MRHFSGQSMVSLLIALIAIGFGAGCKSGPKGNTKAQKQAAVRQMKDAALRDLYASEPGARAEMNQAVGYAVFDNTGTFLLMLASGRGYGIAVDRQSGKETFMKMFELGGGVGIGIKDFRQIMIFRDRAVFDRFIEYGWELGGDADLAATSGGKGGSAARSESTASLQNKVDIYLINKAGAAIQAVATATKYYKDDELN
jgi:lipid-binding SYLF domain-containing protein